MTTDAGAGGGLDRPVCNWHVPHYYDGPLLDALATAEQAKHNAWARAHDVYELWQAAARRAVAAEAEAAQFGDALVKAVAHTEAAEAVIEAARSTVKPTSMPINLWRLRDALAAYDVAHPPHAGEVS